MKMRRHRRKTEWVKVASASGAASTIDILPYFTMSSTAANPVPHMISTFPVILGDQPSAVSTLTEERKNYVVDRIVGRQHIELQGLYNAGTGQTAAPLPWLIRTGFIVLEVSDNGLPMDASFDTVATPTFGVDQNFAEAKWLWVDTMILGANNIYGSWRGDITKPHEFFGTTFPSSNLQGSVDRTKIDVKIRRRVEQSERLFYVCEAAPFAPNLLDYHSAHNAITGYVDTRVLINWTAARSAGMRR